MADQLQLFDKSFGLIHHIRDKGFDQIADDCERGLRILSKACDKFVAETASPPAKHAAKMRSDNVVISVGHNPKAVLFYLGVEVLSQARLRVGDKVELYQRHEPTADFPFALRRCDPDQQEPKGYSISIQPGVDIYRRVNVPLRSIPFALWYGRKLTDHNAGIMTVEFIIEE